MTDEEVEQEFYRLMAEELEVDEWRFGDIQYFSDGMPALDWDGS